MLFPSDCLSFCLFLWLTFSPFHPFKQTLSINSSEISFSQGSGVPKRINKSSQSFWPLWLLTIKIISPGSQSWLPSSPPLTDRQRDLPDIVWVNVSWEGILALLVLHPVLCVLTVHWPSYDQHSLRVRSLTERESHAWSSVRRSDLSWRKPVSFSWSRSFFSPPSVALTQSSVLVKNECWM